MSTDLSLEDYRRILERYLGFFTAYEAIQHEGAFEGLHGVPKTQALRQDLLALGESNDEINALPVCTSLPEIKTRAQALGALYVMNGSELGGLMIAKHLATRPFFSAAAGTFFTADPKVVSGRWRAFLETLESDAQGDEAVVVETALKMFAVLDHWMAGSPS